MAIFRGSGSSLTGSAIDPTEALLDSDFTVNGILVRTGSGVYSTTPDNTANWDTAYSWGDHAAVGYYEPGGTDVAVADGGTGSSSASGARTNLGLGTAAEADLTTSATDTTAGRVLKFGDFGLGEDGANVLWPHSSFNTQGPTGFFRDDGSITDGPPIAAVGGLVLNYNYGSGTGYQVYMRGEETWHRQRTSGVWDSWYLGYHQNTILGTVSESSGVPTGAIIEQGSNSNGEYTKFADGTMICSKLGLSVSFGNSDYLSGTWTYPASFVSAPAPMFNTTPATGDGASVFRKAGTIGSAGEGASITSIRVSAIVGNDWVSGDELTALRGYAIGRWF